MNINIYHNFNRGQEDIEYCDSLKISLAKLVNDLINTGHLPSEIDTCDLNIISNENYAVHTIYISFTSLKPLEYWRSTKVQLEQGLRLIFDLNALCPCSASLHSNIIGYNHDTDSIDYQITVSAIEHF